MKNWTMIEDRWPDRRQKVLAYCQDIQPDKFYYMVLAPIKLTDLGQKKHGSEMIFVDFHGYGPRHMGHDVIAWMPLPKPPED